MMGIESFGKFLDMEENNPELKKLIESLGGKAKVSKDEQLGFISLKKHGIEFRFNTNEWLGVDSSPKVYRLTEVGFYSNGYEKYKGFTGDLVDGLTFTSRRTEVRRALGKPRRTGGGNAFGNIVFKEWDRFRRGEFLFTFSYYENGGAICVVSLTFPSYEDK